MLNRFSHINISDNSGGVLLKILSIKKKNFLSSYATSGDLIFGVVRGYNLRAKKPKLRFKDRASAIVACVKKKKNKKNGIFISFSQNRCITLKISRFIVPLAIHVQTPVFYELVFSKKFKVVFNSSRSFF